MDNKQKLVDGLLERCDKLTGEANALSIQYLTKELSERCDSLVKTQSKRVKENEEFGMATVPSKMKLPALEERLCQVQQSQTKAEHTEQLKRTVLRCGKADNKVEQTGVKMKTEKIKPG